MSKRKPTVHNLALELARERLFVAKTIHEAKGYGTEMYNKTEEDFYPAVIDFVLRCRRATW